MTSLKRDPWHRCSKQAILLPQDAVQAVHLPWSNRIYPAAARAVRRQPAASAAGTGMHIAASMLLVVFLPVVSG